MTPFTKIIDGFQTLSIEEMEEMPIIVNNILVQRKREAIKMNAEDSRKRYEQGVLKSFTEPKALINWLLDDDDKT